jgi:hypothetical protein
MCVGNWKMSIYTGGIGKEMKPIKQLKTIRVNYLINEPPKKSRTEFVHTICRQKCKVDAGRGGPEKFWSQGLQEMLPFPFSTLKQQSLIYVGSQQATFSHYTSWVVQQMF